MSHAFFDNPFYNLLTSDQGADNGERIKERKDTMDSSIKTAMQNFAINQALNYLEGNPEENLPKLMDMVDKFTPKDWYASQRDAVRKTIKEKNNWYCLLYTSPSPRD
mgnify:FL=1